jgi:nitroimidazol reductase NimA-like FMN-containing flavoprotein (pyridoxamine 5'-phosphate oxidase superfamily)
MDIHELSRDECLSVLAEARLARLACAKDNQPYIIPVYIAYDHPPDEEPHLYGFTTEGQKAEWMRANPLVCIEVDDVKAFDQWVTVIILGRFEELLESQRDEGERPRPPQEFQPELSKSDQDVERSDPRCLAYEAMKARPVWWQPGCKPHLHAESTERLNRIYYQIHIDQITGHRAIPDPQAVLPPSTPAWRDGWLHKLRHLARRPPR